MDNLAAALDRDALHKLTQPFRNFDFGPTG